MQRQGADPGEGLTVHKWWVFERLGWVLMFVILLGAVVGVVGRGFILKSTTASPERWMSVEYEPVERFRSPFTVTVRVGPPVGAWAASPPEDFVRVWVHSDYLHRVEIGSITPPPVAVEAAADKLIYVFAPARDSAGAFSFNLTPVEGGRIQGEIGLIGGKSVQFEQFIRP
jgi:hypothetical protein